MNIETSTMLSVESKIRILNNNGRIVKEVIPNGKTRNIQINVANMMSGIYTIQLIDKNIDKNQVVKVILSNR